MVSLVLVDDILSKSIDVILFPFQFKSVDLTFDFDICDVRLQRGKLCLGFVKMLQRTVSLSGYLLEFVVHLCLQPALHPEEVE